jgi:hypothetical protein
MSDNPVQDPRAQQQTADQAAAAARLRTDAVGDPDVRTPHPYTAHQLAWQPDANSHSQRAEAWRHENARLSGQHLDVDAHGYHKVAFGDDLATIAARSLRDRGMAGGANAIKAEEARIISLNQQAFPGFEKNPALLRSGDELRMTDGKHVAGTHVEVPPPGGHYGRIGDPPIVPGQVAQPGGHYGRIGDSPRVPGQPVPPVVAPEVVVQRPPVVVQPPVYHEGRHGQLVAQPGYVQQPGYAQQVYPPGYAQPGFVQPGIPQPGIVNPGWGPGYGWRHYHPNPAGAVLGAIGNAIGAAIGAPLNPGFNGAYPPGYYDPNAYYQNPAPAYYVNYGGPRWHHR